MSTRLLVMSCSERKNRFDVPRPAFEVYDGPAFRVVRKYCEELNAQTSAGRATAPHPALAAPGLYVMIVSAKFGPIPWTRPVDHYDEKLTHAKAMHERDRGAWSQLLFHACASVKPASAFVYGGEDYKLAVPVTGWRTPDCPVELSSGGQGFQLRQLKRWLEGGGDAGD